MIFTVKDLINKLQKYDQDLHVATYLEDDGFLCGRRIFDIYDTDGIITLRRRYDGEIEFLEDGDENGINVLFLKMGEI